VSTAVISSWKMGSDRIEGTLGFLASATVCDDSQ
jgi:hypothetical protein